MEMFCIRTSPFTILFTSLFDKPTGLGEEKPKGVEKGSELELS